MRSLFPTQLLGARVLDASGALQQQGGADRVQRELLQADLGPGVQATSVASGELSRARIRITPSRLFSCA